MAHKTNGLKNFFKSVYNQLPISDELFADAARAARGDASPISDTRGSAAYRKDLIAVLVERALKRAAGRIG